ncbi:MAG TPA: hypothetical protein PKO36_16755, partial [Candidatus Hydrogenedentes bacterium]|nr:hypothetical protein [Candidatus Hydrogenedentota bacterium]
IALLSDYRVVMQNGCVTDVIHTDIAERQFAKRFMRLDDILCRLRDKIRHGGRLTEDMFSELAEGDVA